MRHLTNQLRTASALLAILCAGVAERPVTAESKRDHSTLKPSPAIVIGFVGGFVRHNDSVHSPVQLAARLRALYPSDVYVQVFENRHREGAHETIIRMLDTNHDGRLSDEEKQNARIIIYGMSWGGSETLELARELQKENIPVLLTVQVDSVAKRGQDNRTVPANVAEAANFYQTDGVLHGEPEIKAADPSRTKIMGNFRYDYAAKPVECANYPWYDRLFTKQHTEIECDPEVWNRVESLIRSKLPRELHHASFLENSFRSDLKPALRLSI